jgi:hypothetical protein
LIESKGTNFFAGSDTNGSEIPRSVDKFFLCLGPRFQLRLAI